MQIKSIFFIGLFTSAVSAVEVTFYLGKSCRGQNLGHSSVHELYHNYNAPVNTQSMLISDNGLKRKIIASDPRGCRGETGTADEFRGNGCFSIKNVNTFSCYSMHA